MSRQMNRRQFLRAFRASTVVLLGVAFAANGAPVAGAQPAPVNRLTPLTVPSARASSTVERSQQTKPRLNVATLGHLDHGKTTLTSAITKVLALRGTATFLSFEHVASAPDEQILGTKLAIKRVEYETATRQYAHVDCPAQADYLKAMITGAARLDGAVLVVSAADGPMPQTREHILLARQIDVPEIVVFMNKLDLLDDDELLDLVELEVRELLTKYGFPGKDVPVVRGSARQALTSSSLNASAPEFKSIVELLDTLDQSIPTPTPQADRPFLMTVEDVFAIKGRGTIVTGRIERGRIKAGDAVEIVGTGETRSTTVTEVEMARSIVGEGVAGQEVGILLREVERPDVDRGDAVAYPGAIRQRSRFGAEVYMLLPTEAGRRVPIFDGYNARLAMRLAGPTGTVNLPDGVEMVMPGEQRRIEITLKTPMALNRGARFTINDGGHTICVGVVTDLLA